MTNSKLINTFCNPAKTDAQKLWGKKKLKITGNTWNTIRPQSDSLASQFIL